jgi:hypothetical protein
MEMISADIVQFCMQKKWLSKPLFWLIRLTNEFCMQKIEAHTLQNAMLQLDFHPTGRHFLQIPGPSPVPDRILRAMSLPTIDHRGPEFGALGKKVLADIQKIFQTRHPVMIYPASGTGAWEAALTNVLSPATRC